MKVAVLVARILLGLVFLLFGLNMIFQFLPSPPLQGDVAAISRLMYIHKWIAFYGFLEAASALLLLVGRFVPLALTVLAGIVVNILLFHITLNMSGIGPGLFCGLLDVFLVYAYRASFAGIFAANAQVTS
jgi:uncharacterized membrane protein YphA (DoxX/SURF4 family)